MSGDDIRSSFTAGHHALLFGWIAREVIERLGEERGEEVLKKAVWKYGEQRGRRMALRIKADGRAPNMVNYRAYGEWEAGKGEMEIKVVARKPHLHVQVFKCCWTTAWEENGLSQYARCYCPTADEAIVHGFNPDLTIDIPGNRANGDSCCDLIFRDANVTLVDALVMNRRKKKVREKALMPWDYHTGHIYKTMGEVVISELGEEGEKAVAAALKKFTDRYGEEAAQILDAYRGTDFDLLP